MPGIIEGAKDGKGRGKQVIAGELHLNLTKLRLLSAPKMCVYFSCTYMQFNPYSSRRPEAFNAQKNNRKRAGRIRHSSKQTAAKHSLQTKGQRWH